jgi:hypothetical protein
MKTLENPYAFVDRDMATDDAVASSSKIAALRRIDSHKVVDGQQDLFAHAEVSLPRESIGSGNPYGNVTFEDEPPRLPVHAGVSTRQTTRTSTKEEFRKASALIFSRYSPVLLRGRLRPHHREFIVRNESRSPRARFEMLNALRKFDLSELRGLTTYLNREDNLLSDAVLKAIEDSVDDAE